MNKSFRVFKRSDKVFHLTKGTILFIIMLITISIHSVFDQKIIFLKYLAGLSMLTYFAYFLTECFRYQFLDGIFTGNISFNKENLVIEERIIEITEIKKIFLRVDDYKGKSKITYLTYFPMSNGTNNLLDLELKNGEKINLFFELENQIQVKDLKPFIVSLIKNKIIDFEKGIEWLQIDYESEIKEIELEINKKEF